MKLSKSMQLNENNAVWRCLTALGLGFIFLSKVLSVGLKVNVLTGGHK